VRTASDDADDVKTTGCMMTHMTMMMMTVLLFVDIGSSRADDTNTATIDILLHH